MVCYGTHAARVLNRTQPCTHCTIYAYSHMTIVWSYGIWHMGNSHMVWYGIKALNRDLAESGCGLGNPLHPNPRQHNYSIIRSDYMGIWHMVIWSYGQFPYDMVWHKGLQVEFRRGGGGRGQPRPQLDLARIRCNAFRPYYYTILYHTILMGT